MNVSPASLEEFKRIYHPEYGRLLDDEEAAQAAQQLVEIVTAVYQPGKESYGPE